MSSPWAGFEIWTNLGSWRCWLQTATCSLLGSCSLVAEARVLRTLGLYLAARPLQDAWRQQMEENLKGLLAVQLSGLAAPAATAVEEAESKKSLRTGAVGHTCPQSPAQQCVEHDQQKCSGSTGAAFLVPTCPAWFAIRELVQGRQTQRHPLLSCLSLNTAAVLCTFLSLECKQKIPVRGLHYKSHFFPGAGSVLTEHPQLWILSVWLQGLLFSG